MERYINGNGIKFDLFFKNGVEGWFVRTYHKNGLRETYHFMDRQEGLKFMGEDCVRYE